jgi:hypothetical protein
VVLIASRAQEGLGKELLAALQGQLSDLPVTLRTEWVDRLPEGLPAQVLLSRTLARDPTALLTVWADQPATGDSFLYVGDPRGQGLLVRNLSEAAGGRSEAAALIVRRTVRALLQGGRLGVEPAAQALVIPPPRPPPPPPRDPLLAVEAGYALSVYAAQARAVHGLHVAAAVRVHRLLHVLLSYQVWAPLRPATTQVEAEITRHPIYAGLRFLWPFRWIGVGATVGLGVDPITARATPIRDNVQAEPPRTDVGGSFWATAHLDVRLVRRVHAYLAAGVETPLSRAAYTVGGSTRDLTLLLPYPVQPLVSLGLSVKLW